MSTAARLASLLSLTFTLLLPSPVEPTTFPWLQSGNDAAHTGANRGPSPVTNETLWISSTGGGVFDVAAVALGRVFAQSANGVIALNEQTGAVVRSYAVAGPRNIAISGSRLVVADQAGAVHAFDIDTGSLVWIRPTSPTNNIAVDGGRVFTNTGISDGKLRALDELTGSPLWTFTGIVGSSSPPTVANGRVFQNSHGDGSVVAVDTTSGALLWRTSLGAGAFPAARVVADAARVFVGTQSGRLVALDQETGTIVWDVSLGGEIYAGGTADGLAFAISFSGVVYAVNADTGTIFWSFNTGAGSQSSAVATAGGRVFFSDAGRVLHALDELTGSSLWSRSEAVAPIVADGRVFVISSGEVLAIGAPSLTVSPPTGLLTSPARFDLTLIADTAAAVVSFSATLDGADVSAPLASCVRAGTLIGAIGQTFRCPGITGSLFGSGLHTLIVTVNLDNGSSATETVFYTIDNPQAGITISPPSGDYVFTQGFDVSIAVNAPGLSIVGGSATLDDADVTEPLLGCLLTDSLPAGQIAFRCPGLSGDLFGAGPHTFSATVNFNNGSSASGSATWYVRNNTEP